jgi:hypothetical protein
LCGDETGTLLKVDQKYLGGYEMWCWRRMGKTSWNDRVRNDEVVGRDKEERNILRKTERRTANWIDQILRRNRLTKHIIEGKIEEMMEVAGKRGRRSKHLLNDLKKTIVYRKLKAEALDRTV